MTESEIPRAPSAPASRSIVLAASAPEVQKLEQKYRDMVERAPIGVYESVPDGRLLTANSALARMLGYDSVAELLQTNLSAIYANPRERELLVAAFERVGTSADLELQWKRKDGQPVWVQVNAHTVVHPADGSLRFEGFVRDITVRRRTEQELRAHREELGALSQRLIEVQETERRSLARELHDEVGQLLTALKLTLQAVQRSRSMARTRALVREGLGLLDQCLQQVRSLSLELRPSLLDDLGLGPALRWYLDRQSERAGFAAHLEDQLNDRRLPSEVETTCYRVAQEALTNVARHARAREVRVTLAQRDGHVQLRIRDDGVGFDVAHGRERAAAGESLGLLSMEERVSLAGGTFEVRSTPGSGSEVRVELPIGPAGAGRVP
ncbi:MAG: PAS domain S-box protein [Gemmatimonadetes bacterium]|nr:PAS domain S-box protein [Gemmatimonadota bacterium]